MSRCFLYVYLVSDYKVNVFVSAPKGYKLKNDKLSVSIIKYFNREAFRVSIKNIYTRLYSIEGDYIVEKIVDANECDSNFMIKNNNLKELFYILKLNLYKWDLQCHNGGNHTGDPCKICGYKRNYMNEYIKSNKSKI